MSDNMWKTSDIRITTDSVGYLTAEHKWQGTLIESEFYDNRTECRRDAVEILRERKNTYFRNYQ